MPRCKVDDKHRNEERGNFLIPSFQKSGMVPLDSRQSAEARTDKNPNTFSIGIVDYQSGILHGKMGRAKGVLDEQIHLLYFFFVDEILSDKILDFAGNLNRHLRSVKTGN